MRRFRFRLTPLLRLRSQLERRARKELAQAMAAVNEFDRKIEAADQGLRDCADQAVRTDSVGRLARQLETGLRRHRWRIGQQKQLAERQLDAVRADYAQKARELEALQRLRDQAHEAWRQETIRQEQAEIDELAMLTQAGRDIDGGERACLA